MHALIVRFEGQNADFGGFGGGSFPQQQQQQKTLVRLCPDTRYTKTYLYTIVSCNHMLSLPVIWTGLATADFYYLLPTTPLANGYIEVFNLCIL